MKTIDYVTLSRNYHGAIRWLESFDIQTRQSRLGRYAVLLDELSAHHIAGTLGSCDFRAEFAGYVNAVFEAVEIIRIHKGLADFQSPILGQKLREVAGGRLDRPAPSDADLCRNSVFELLIAARLQSAGLDIALSEAEEDVLVNFRGIEVFIECKRLKSAKKVRQRVKGALKQLRTRYENAASPKSARGLVALSITDLANPEHYLMVDGTPEKVYRAIEAGNAAFVRKHCKLWQGRDDEQTLGTIVEFSAPAVVENSNILTTCHSTIANNSCLRHTPDCTLFLALMDVIASGIE